MSQPQTEFFRQLADARHLLDALDQLPGAMFMIKDRASRYMYMSRALREAIHLPPGFDVIGKTDFDLFPKVIAQSFRQNDLVVFRHGRPLVKEVHATHPTRWGWSSKYPLRDRRGRICGLITINQEYNEVMGQDAELNRLLPAIEHVTEHFAGRITIPQLAKLCGYSESQFARVFKRHLKLTAFAYIEQVRMQHALAALERSAASISQIAVESGFYDHSAFVKRFKKLTGSTPLRHRRAHQERLKSSGTFGVQPPVA